MKKILATLLALVLVLGMIPMSGIIAFAEDDELSLMIPELPNSQANPYVIGSLEDWLTFCLTPSILTENAYFMLTADIDFADHNVTDYVSTGDKNMDCTYSDIFKGTLDGNGHALKNLDIICASGKPAGIFKQTLGAKFINLTLDNVDFTVANATADGTSYAGLLVGSILPCVTDASGALVDLENPEGKAVLFDGVVVTDSCSLTTKTPNSSWRLGILASNVSRASNAESQAFVFKNCYVGGTVTVEKGYVGGGASIYCGALLGGITAYKSNSEANSAQLLIDNCVTNMTINYNYYKITTGNFAYGGAVGEVSTNELIVRDSYFNTAVNMNWGTPYSYTKSDGSKVAAESDKSSVLQTGGVGGIIGTLGRAKSFTSGHEIKDYVIENCVTNLTLGGDMYANTSADPIPYTGAIVGLLGNPNNIGFLMSDVKVENVTYAINSTKYAKYGNSRPDLAYPTANDPSNASSSWLKAPTEYHSVKETAGTVKLAQAAIALKAIELGIAKIAPVVTTRDVAAIKLDTNTNIKFWAENANAATEFFKTKCEGLTVTETGVAILKKADYEAANRDVAAVDASKVKFAKVGETVSDTIAAADYATEYVAVGYAKISYGGQTYTMYRANATSAKSVAGIAALAIAETAVTYTDAQKAALTALAPAAN